MSETYKGDYAPDLFNEDKHYFLFQAQEKANLTDAELRDLNKISNTYTRRFIQDQVGDAASVSGGFKIIQGDTVSDQSNNFQISAGSTYLYGYRLALNGSILYSDQTRFADHTSVSAITTNGFTETILSKPTTPTGTVASLYGIAMAGTDIYACGDGTMVKSTDSGISWVINDTGYNYKALSFCNPSTGIVVGDAVLKTTVNSGTTWNNYVLSAYLNSASIVSSADAWAVGNDGTVLRSVGDLVTWVSQNSETNAALYGVAASDALNAWVVGSNATVISTTDSGTNWGVESVAGITGALHAVQAIDATNVFIVGADGTYVRKLNNSSWQVFNAGTTEDLRALYFKDKYTGWAVGDNGTITQTSDSGSTWQSKTIAGGADLKSVVFSDTTGFVDGTNGLIYRTLDGTNWAPYRTDYVYVDFHLAEVSGDTTSGSEYLDPGLVDSSMGLPSANRLRLVSDVKISEGWPIPADYTLDGTVMHYTTLLASFHRIADRTSILESDITDLRNVVKTLSEIEQAMVSGGFDTSAIADEAITPDKLQSTGDFVVGSLSASSDLIVGGDMTVAGGSSYNTLSAGSMQVTGDTVLGDSSTDTHSIYGSVSQTYGGIGIAYNLEVTSSSDSTPVYNIHSVGSGEILKIERDNTDSTRNVVDIINTGSGFDFNVIHSGTAGGILRAVDDATGTSIELVKDTSSGMVLSITTTTGSSAIAVFNTGTGTTTNSLFISQNTGTIISLDSGDATGIQINSSGISDDLRINHAGSQGLAIDVTSSSSSGSVNIHNIDGQAVTIKQMANATLMSLDKTGTGLGLALEVSNRGSDVGVGVYNTGSGIGQLISHVGDSTNPGLDIFVAGSETGPALRVNKSNDMTGEVAKLWNQGYSETLVMNHDRTDSSASVVMIDNKSQGLDVSSNNWYVDNSGNFYTNGLVTSAVSGAWAAYDVTSAVVGFASLTSRVIHYKKDGRTISVNFNIDGVSDSSVFTFTLPYYPSNPTRSLGVGVGYDGISDFFVNINYPDSSRITVQRLPNDNIGWPIIGNKWASGTFFFEQSDNS